MQLQTIRHVQHDRHNVSAEPQQQHRIDTIRRWRPIVGRYADEDNNNANDNGFNSATPATSASAHIGCPNDITNANDDSIIHSAAFAIAITSIASID